MISKLGSDGAQAPNLENESTGSNYRDRRHATIAIAIFLLAVFVTGLFIGSSVSYLSKSGEIAELTGELSSLRSKVSALESEVAALQSSYDASASGALSFGGSLNSLYESVKDSIVTVHGLVMTSSAWGIPYYTEVIGSGFIVNLTGSPLVVTNFHVVDGMVNGSVSFITGEAYPFRVVGYDKYSDLAVLQVEGAPPEKLVPLSVASSSTLAVGDTVVAIGSAYGLESTLTSGIVSQLNRAIQTETSESYLIAGVIQITAPINPGNSGGPLLDSSGRVVGITTAIISSSQNIGFAIPSDTLIKEIGSLVSTGSYKHPYIGITGITVDYLISRAAGLEVTYGVLVQTVAPGSPASTAGLQGGTRALTVPGERFYVGGDLIVAVDGNRVRSLDDLVSYVDLTAAPGDTIEFTIIRGEIHMSVDVTLGSYG
ncbi:MAG: trypsin-like peptidase domain-containing protein [Candidatus Verstraetearchaeota archaeon]|nr:trypsin-like peptidase domain-containing protein [Candidatus Verstraetearchaeota archaeon]